MCHISVYIYIFFLSISRHLLASFRANVRKVTQKIGALLRNYVSFNVYGGIWHVSVVSSLRSGLSQGFGEFHCGEGLMLGYCWFVLVYTHILLTFFKLHFLVHNSLYSNFERCLLCLWVFFTFFFCTLPWPRNFQQKRKQPAKNCCHHCFPE